MIELKPCPFCGGEARIKYHAERKNSLYSIVWGTLIFCQKCGAEIFHGIEERAYSNWNRRVTDGTD